MPLKRLLFALSCFCFLSITSLVYSALGPGTEQERFEKDTTTKESEARLEEGKAPELQVSGEAAGGSKETVEEVSFFVEKIIVTGNTVVSDREIRAVTAPHEGKELKLSEVKQIAEEITRLYRAKGYLTSRAYIPPQKIESKTLEIQMLEGKLGTAEVSGNRYFRKENILRFLKKDEKKVLKYDKIQKDIIKMNLHPDREVKAVIVPGKELGLSDLVLNVADRFPVHVGGEVNNFGTKLTGKERYNVFARHTNLTGSDDILAGRVQFGEEVFATGVQYVRPLGPWETEIGAGFNYTDVNIGGDFSALDIAGTAYAYSVFANQPLFDTKYFDVTWTGSFESKSIHNEVLGSPSSNDELRMLHTGLNFDEIDPYGRTFIVNDFTFGIDAFGASDRNDPRLSRAGAGAGFAKYNVTANRIHPFFASNLLYLKASGQITGDRLVSAEQYDLGGVYSVRGYPQSDTLGDSGGGGSVELRVPFYFIPRETKVPWTQETLWNRLHFVGFFDGAYAKLKNPAVGEDGSKTYLGAGGGLRFDFPHNLTGRFEWAAPIGDRPTDGSHSQFYFSVAGELF